MPGQRTDIGRFETAENSPMPIEQAVWMHPEVMSGKLCFRDTRIPISTLFKFLADGSTIEEYLNDYDIDPDAFAAVMLAAGQLACEAAERQLPREPGTATRVKILLDTHVPPGFYKDLSDELDVDVYSDRFLRIHTIRNGRMHDIAETDHGITHILTFDKNMQYQTNSRVSPSTK